MDSHLASATERAGPALTREMPGLSICACTPPRNGATTRTALDALPRRHRARRHRHRDDAVPGGALPARSCRPCRRAANSCDAMVGGMSAGEVMKLTRIGRFSMDAPQGGALALPEAAAGSGNGSRSASAGAQQMKMLRRLPQILRFIPGTAQDVRAYFLTLQYWLAGSDENVANMVRLLVDRYADGARRALRGALKVDAAGRVSGGRRLPPAPRGPHRASAPTRCPARRRDGTVGLLVHALLPAGRQHRALRRRDRRAGGARPARDPGLRHRPRLAAGDREVLPARRPADGRRAGLAHRLLAGRRPGLQRRQGRRGHAGPARRALPRRRTRSSSRRSSNGRRRDRGLLPVEVDHDGGDPGARRRHRARWCSAAAPTPAGCTGCARGCTFSADDRDMHPASSAPRCWRPASPSWSRCAAPQRAERKVGRRAVQLPAQRRQHRHGRLSRRSSSRCTTRCRR